uniref:Protein-tyrosine-phosphatase n=1 Tax=Ascaris lumbricoides TaxID=6252 RepID=A0A0M3IMG1_ASCLU
MANVESQATLTTTASAPQMNEISSTKPSNTQDTNNERVSSTTVESSFSTAIPVAAVRAVTDIPLSGGSPDNRKTSTSPSLLHSRSTPNLDASGTCDQQPALQLPVSNVSKINSSHVSNGNVPHTDSTVLLTFFQILSQDYSSGCKGESAAVSGHISGTVGA